MSLPFFKVGDVVILKGTGGPAMTVSGMPGVNDIEKYYFTKWFDDGNHLHDSMFHQDTLILIPQEER